MTDHPDGYPEQKCLICEQVRRATFAEACPCLRDTPTTCLYHRRDYFGFCVRCGVDLNPALTNGGMP